jgi:GlpG protein
MIEIAKAPIDADLLGFSRWLSSQGVPHRVVEEQSEQVLLMPESEVNEKVRQALVAYLDDTDIRAAIDEQSYERVAPTRHIMTEYPRAKPLQAPIVFVLMLTSIVVAWLTNFGQGGALLRALLIVNPLALEVNLNTLDGRIDGLWMMLGTGEYWRLITPDILHFSLLHICFNLVMLWVLGASRNEARNPVIHAAGCCCVGLFKCRAVFRQWLFFWRPVWRRLWLVWVLLGLETIRCGRLYARCII